MTTPTATMSRIRYAMLGLGACFILLLLIVTFRSTSTPLDLAPGDRASAQQACRRAVLTRVPDARFPHDASVEARGTGRLHLSGSVDAEPAPQAVRRNYECVLRREASGGYAVDSVTVWQSH